MIVALFVAAFFGVVVYLWYATSGKDRTDFSQAQFGARALIHGGDPYKLVGPERVYESRWPVMYPVTTYVAALPFASVPDRIAAAIFVAASTFLLVWGITIGSWHRLPMIVSVSFLTSVQYAQWSILMTAIMFLPAAAFFSAVKPQSALPILIASPARTWLWAAAGGLVLFALSLFFFPTWPLEWWSIIRGGEQMKVPLFAAGGFLLAFVLLRWRRREAWLVFVAALMPQSWAWYNTLVLLGIARTYREATVLSLISSGGAIAAAYVIHDSSPASYGHWMTAAVLFAYIPAMVAVLLRPNVREATLDAVPQSKPFR